ncbi:hypothetical protein PUN28_014136 [Cardiocondyla obscurior]|uniref:Secreted protein n=1 Tax=Cardiocondyla obscurior TaxID=286306 RepID=A0AAW2F221_9HYME
MRVHFLFFFFFCPLAILSRLAIPVIQNCDIPRHVHLSSSSHPCDLEPTNSNTNNNINNNINSNTNNYNNCNIQYE